MSLKESPKKASEIHKIYDHINGLQSSNNRIITIVLNNGLKITGRVDKTTFSIVKGKTISTISIFDDKNVSHQYNMIDIKEAH